MLGWFRNKRQPAIEENLRKQQDLRFEQQAQQIMALRGMLDATEKRFKDLESITVDFCKQLLQRRLAQSHMGTSTLPSMDTISLVQYTKKQIAQMNMEDQAQLMEMLQSIERYKQQVGGMQIQISQLLQREKALQQRTELANPQREEAYLPNPLMEPSVEPSSDESQTKALELSGNPSQSSVVPVEIVEIATTPKAEGDGRRQDRSGKPQQQPPKPKQNDQQPDRKERPNVAQAEIVHDAGVTSVSGKPTGAETMHVIDLRNLLERLNDQDWIILMLIGEDGLSTAKDIKDRARDAGMTDTAIQRSLQKIRDTGVISEERVNVSIKWFWAYELTDVGHRLYVKKTGKHPVECEKARMVREHATATHGYGIRETADIFQQMEGVISVEIERTANTINLPGDRRCIPDVIVTFESGDKLYVEYELGHHTQADFEDKCDRLFMVSPDLVFVTPDQQSFVTIKTQVEKWLAKREQDMGKPMRDCQVHATTLSKLNKGVWEFEWPPAPDSASA